MTRLDYGALLLNPRRRKKRRTPPRTKSGRFRKRRSSGTRRRTTRRRRRNPVLMTAANPSRRRRRRSPRKSYARRRRSYRRRNPSVRGFVGRAKRTLVDAGFFLAGDLAADVLTSFVWRKLGVGEWLGRQAWVAKHPDVGMGLGRIGIALAAYPLLRALRVPERYAKAVSFGGVVSGGLLMTRGIKQRIHASLGLSGIGDYMAVPDAGMGDYLQMGPPSMGRLPSDRAVEASFYNHYN